MMTYKQSLRTCLLQKYATFSGRASRSEYWWFMLTVIAVLVLPGLGFSVAQSLGVPVDAGYLANAVVTVGSIFFAIFGLAILIPSLAVTVRRFHDINLSGWWYLGLVLATFVPVVGFLATLANFGIPVLKGTQGPNRFGPDPLKPDATSVFE
jgi:uncharacterized membrane protein YhaH (DUF805 family)